MRLRADQPLHGLPDHHAGEREQQCRFGKRGDALDLAVAKLMLGIGRLAGNAYSKISEQRCREIDQGMAGFRENRQRPGQEPDHGLRRRQPRRRDDRSERGLFLGVHLRPLGRDGLTVVGRGVNAQLCDGRFFAAETLNRRNKTAECYIAAHRRFSVAPMMDSKTLGRKHKISDN